MENKDIGYRDKECFLVYLDDNNQQVSAYVYVVDIKENLITFKTPKNIITIPTSRVIKMKEKI
ncbi:MAG: hypothetical protein NTX24_02605 [Candidatus Pacearchaeota archaeon]|nr:hypothetical protein [Candidatus Pacearchaeota archaeon]